MRKHANINLKTTETFVFFHVFIIIIILLSLKTFLGSEAPDDFGGAIYTALDCNKAALHKSRKLMEAHLEDAEAQKVDAVVALTHQDLEIDLELAKAACSVGIQAVLGGHDHTEYAARVHGCVVLKSGMDAKNAAVMDLLWNQEEKRIPSNSIEFNREMNPNGYPNGFQHTLLTSPCWR